MPPARWFRKTRTISQRAKGVTRVRVGEITTQRRPLRSSITPSLSADNRKALDVIRNSVVTIHVVGPPVSENLNNVDVAGNTKRLWSSQQKTSKPIGLTQKC